MLYNYETRSIIILVCTHIYENKPKHNLLQTCKFIYGLKSDIFFYQPVNFFKCVDMIKNKSEIFSNIEYLSASTWAIAGYSNPLIISLLPHKLKKLKISCNCEFIGCSLPKTLHTLKYYSSKFVTADFFPNNLKKISIEGDFTFGINSNILPPNLTYLKFLSMPKFDFILHKLPPKLKCLILKYKKKEYSYKDNYDLNHENISMLPDNIKHFTLGESFGFSTFDQIKKIIPKNIKHLNFGNYTLFDILSEYLLLTKITIKYHHNYNHTERWLPSIPHTIINLCIINYDNILEYYIPSHVKKLKIDNVNMTTTLPKTIQELEIKNFSITNNDLFKPPPNIKKLTVRYKDHHFLDLALCPDCQIRYKY